MCIDKPIKSYDFKESKNQLVTAAQALIDAQKELLSAIIMRDYGTNTEYRRKVLNVLASTRKANEHLSRAHMMAVK